MQIKLLFINAIVPSDEIETRYPPLGIGYLVSTLRKHFGEETIEFKVIEDNIEQEIMNFKPDIVGISSVSQNYSKAIAYAKIAKRYGLPVICGGVHISMMPSSLTMDMDVGVTGEGEETICDLFELFRRKREFVEDNLQKIKGIIYWNKNNRIVATDKRDLIYPLDKLPFPARDLLRIQSSTYIFSSRGCPYRCTFCASSRFWDKIRFFSAEYVVSEIEYLVDEYNVKNISFQDDLFALDEKRIERIISLLREKDLIGRVNFSGAMRANLVNDRTIELLREMGVNSIGMGLESGSNKTLKYLKRDSIDIKNNENAVRIIKKHRISVYGSFIIGSPEETKEDILETLKFIRKSHLDGFGVYVLTPFPGTPVWNYAMSRGLVDEKMDWDILNVNFENNYNSAVILSEKLTREEIYELFLRFKQYQRKREIHNLIKKGLRNPLKIPVFLIKKITNQRKKPDSTKLTGEKIIGDSRKWFARV